MRPVYSRYDACAAYHICGHLDRRFDNVVHDRRKRGEKTKQMDLYLLIDFIAFTIFITDYNFATSLIGSHFFFSLVQIFRVTVWARRILDTNARTHKYDATRRNRQIREWTNQDAARRTFAHSKENLHKMDEFIFIEGNYHITTRANAHAFIFFLEISIFKWFGIAIIYCAASELAYSSISYGAIRTQLRCRYCFSLCGEVKHLKSHKFHSIRVSIESKSIKWKCVCGRTDIARGMKRWQFNKIV